MSQAGYKLGLPTTRAGLGVVKAMNYIQRYCILFLDISVNFELSERNVLQGPVSQT